MSGIHEQCQEDFLKKQIEAWIQTDFGPRCDTFEETCIVCRKWKALDEMFDGLTTPAECDSDPWVTQDRVPARVGIDEYRYASFEEDDWKPVTGDWDDFAVHGWVDHEGDTLLLRCRASQLPEVCAAEPQLNEDPDEWVEITDPHIALMEAEYDDRMPQPVEVTDRRGVVLVLGQKVFVLQAEQTRLATVVEVSESRSSNGWWVDVDFGHGPEGMPSNILEVCNAPAQPPPEDPDEWVIQDRVPPRKDIDQICWGGGDWHSDWHKEWQFEKSMHGYRPRFGGVLNVRCRRRDLPKVEPKTTDDFGMYLESVIAKDPQLKAEVDAAEAEAMALLKKPEPRNRDEALAMLVDEGQKLGMYGTPQTAKTRVRLFASFGALHICLPGEITEGIGREIHYDAETKQFYVEQQ